MQALPYCMQGGSLDGVGGMLCPTVSVMRIRILLNGRICHLCAPGCMEQRAGHNTERVEDHHDRWRCCSNLRSVTVCLLAWPHNIVTSQRYVCHALHPLAGLHELCQPECKA